MTGLAKKMLMSKVNSGSPVRLGETNVYAILGSTKKGPAEFAKMAAVKVEAAGSAAPIKNVVNLPSDNYFQGYMTYEQAGRSFSDTFPDFSMERYMEIMEFLKFDRQQPIEKMPGTQVMKLKIAVVLSRNSRVYMLENPFKGMNESERDEMLKVIFSWAVEANTIAVMCNTSAEMEQMVSYADAHAGELPALTFVKAAAMSESYA
jgi:ABC-2 type transport system ATP-binding protein